jgi:hypothetical protein
VLSRERRPSACLSALGTTPKDRQRSRQASGAPRDHPSGPRGVWNGSSGQGAPGSHHARAAAPLRLSRRTHPSPSRVVAVAAPKSSCMLRAWLRQSQLPPRPLTRHPATTSEVTVTALLSSEQPYTYTWGIYEHEYVRARGGSCCFYSTLLDVASSSFAPVSGPYSVVRTVTLTVKIKASE